MAEQIFIIEDGTLTKFECDDYVEEVYIPDRVKKIGCQAFFEAAVGKVVLSDSVTTIEADAFLDCTLSEMKSQIALQRLKHGLFPAVKTFRALRSPKALPQ